MYKKNESNWAKHLDFIILDIITLQIAFLLAYMTRHGLVSPYRSEMYRDSVIIMTLASIIASFFAENHKNILRRGYLQELKSVLQHIFFVTVVLLGFLFFVQLGGSYSRMVVFYFVIYGIIFMMLERIAWKKWLLSRPISAMQARHMLLLTSGKIASSTVKKLYEQSFGEFEIVGIVLIDDAMPVGSVIEKIEVVAEYKDIVGYVHRRWIDEVMIYLPRDIDNPVDLLKLFTNMGITTHVYLDLQTDDHAMRTLDRVADCLVLTESVRIGRARDIFIKRVVDIIGSVVGLVLTGIFTIIIGPIIFLSDPGPIFFTQRRIGKNGRIFNMYKFRSMYQDAEERKAELLENNTMEGFMFKMDADPRIIGSGADGTRHGIGWFIRKTSIDEFPQFLNVLKGEMSLVGMDSIIRPNRKSTDWYLLQGWL